MPISTDALIFGLGYLNGPRARLFKVQGRWLRLAPGAEVHPTARPCQRAG